MLFLLSGIAAANILFLLLYVSGTGSFPKPLSAEEEKRYLRLAADGDIHARNMLIEHNLRLVAHVVKKYYSASRDQEDLIQVGTIGLIKAIQSFNPDKNIRLATYAAKCVENEVLMYFRSSRKISSEVSLSRELDGEGDGAPLQLMDVLSSGDSLVEDVELKMRISRLYGLVESVLTERERKIICMRYGLCGTKPRAQREVAARLGISRSYVSRIEKKALEKLRHAFEGS